VNIKLLRETKDPQQAAGYRMHIYLLLLCLVIISCKEKKFTNERLALSGPTGVVNCRIQVPKGGDFKEIYHGFDVEYRYYYGDSLILYISNKELPNLNGTRIYDLGDTAVMRVLSDTLTIEGVEEKKAWKDVKLASWLSAGYVNVPVEIKPVFDSALNSIRLEY